jgi:hypothetical protein
MEGRPRTVETNHWNTSLQTQRLFRLIMDEKNQLQQAGVFLADSGFLPSNFT